MTVIKQIFFFHLTFHRKIYFAYCGRKTGFPENDFPTVTERTWLNQRTGSSKESIFLKATGNGVEVQTFLYMKEKFLKTGCTEVLSVFFLFPFPLLLEKWFPPSFCINLAFMQIIKKIYTTFLINFSFLGSSLGRCIEVKVFLLV